MKGILEILLLINLIKGCPLKTKKQTTTSIKRCYKTITSRTISTSITSSMSTTTSSMSTVTSSMSTITSSMLTSTTSSMSTSTTSSMSTITSSMSTVTSSMSTSTTSVPTETTGPISNIPITSGRNATLTYFTDTVTQCYGGDIPLGNGLAVNPLLLGFTLSDWNDKYSNADPNIIPWCGKMMNVTVNGKTYTGRIIDTCAPSDGGEFIDPNTGQMIGSKCDYDNVIDLYGEAGLSFLQDTVGDDFYQGSLEWVIY